MKLFFPRGKLPKVPILMICTCIRILSLIHVYIYMYMWLPWNKLTTSKEVNSPVVNNFNLETIGQGEGEQRSLIVFGLLILRFKKPSRGCSVSMNHH